MKKKYRIILYTSIFLLCVVASIILVVKKSNSVYEEESKPKVVKHKSMLSMNLEQTAGSGDYKTVTQSSWPTEGYKFNAELSKCENGSTLSWDDTKKAVIMQGNVSDKCYVYFDIWIPSIADYCTSGTDLATCVKNFGDQGPSVSNIYIHNSSLTNGAGDNSYRYAGANPNNFVCFGSDASPCPIDNLYRIIGVFGENYHGANGKQLVKLIKYDYATSASLGTDGDYQGSWTPDSSTYKGSLTKINTYFWNYKNDTSINNGYGSNTWSTSLLNKTNLNSNFINNLGSIWANKIATTTWKVGGNTYSKILKVGQKITYQNEIVIPDPANSTDNLTEYNAKIGLMYASDYGFAASPGAWTTTLYYYSGSVNGATIKSQNWMQIGYYDWTISRSSDYTDEIFNVLSDGSVNSGNPNGNRGVRPSFNLESTVSYVSGSGTQSDPIRII